jgi:hypothetical protein
VDLTAEIQPAAPGAGVPTGIVTLEAKKKRLETAALSDGSATLSVRPIRVQKQVVTIIYSGDAGFLSSTTTLRQPTQASLNNLARPVMLQ